MNRRTLFAACGALAAATLIWGCSDKSTPKPAGAPGARPAASRPAAVPDTPVAAYLTAATDRIGSTPIAPGPSALEPIESGSPAPWTFLTPPDPAATRAAWQEGVALFEAGDYPASAGFLGTAAAGRADEPYVHYLHGLALWKSGQPDGAVAALERSAGLDGESIRTFVNLARVRLDLGRAGPALEAADAALALAPGAPGALHQRGRALALLNRADEALAALVEARGADPGNGYIANTLGYVLLQRGEPGEALPHLIHARDTLPRVAYVRNNLGAVYERLGETEKAMEEFRAAVAAGDPEGKAAASVARLEPLVERIMARRGESCPLPAGAGAPVAATPVSDSTTVENVAATIDPNGR